MPPEVQNLLNALEALRKETRLAIGLCNATEAKETLAISLLADLDLTSKQSAVSEALQTVIKKTKEVPES